MSGRRVVISGGTVATDYGVFEADVVIEDGRVAAIAEGAGRNGADEVIDATGLVVMPGAIDMHAHFEDPGHTEREDFTTGTMSAAAGGMTTIMEHPLTYPPVTTRELYVEKREMAKRKVVIDFGLWGALTAPSIPEIAGQHEEGAVGFKAFMPISDPSYPHVTDAEFLDGMREVEGGRRPGAGARRERLAAAGRARPDEGRGPHRPAGPPRVAAGRSSRRRPSTGRSTSPPTPTCGSRSCTSPARSAPSS